MRSSTKWCVISLCAGFSGVLFLFLSTFPETTLNNSNASPQPESPMSSPLSLVIPEAARATSASPLSRVPTSPPQSVSSLRATRERPYLQPPTVGEQGTLCGREALEKFLVGGVELLSLTVLSGAGDVVSSMRNIEIKDHLKLEVGQSIRFLVSEVTNSSSRRFFFNARAYHFSKVVSDGSSPMLGADAVANDMVAQCTLVEKQQVCTSLTHIVLGPFPTTGIFGVDLLATWYDDRFLGQKWFLPPRNNNPPWLTKKKVCHDLKLVGNCDRFGVQLFRRVAHVNEALGGPEHNRREQASPPPICSTASQLNSPGTWERLMVRHTKDDDLLLSDPFGLNSFNGSSWAWRPARRIGKSDRAGIESCNLERFTGETLEELLFKHKVRKVALFGDSMMVEQFEMLRALLTPDLKPDRSNLIKPSGGKWRGKTRWFQFGTKRGLTVRFMRGYTTDKKGASVISPASQVWAQLKEFGPDLTFGNLAVLHWQQNQRTFADWSQNLDEFTSTLKKIPLNERKRVLYVGATLIQMGRTAGLQPARTQQFTKAAAEAFTTAGSNFVDPYWLSLPRREAAYDGQHWACYHEVGGVSHTINQLILNHIAVVLQADRSNSL